MGGRPALRQPTLRLFRRPRPSFDYESVIRSVDEVHDAARAGLSQRIRKRAWCDGCRSSARWRERLSLARHRDAPRGERDAGALPPWGRRHQAVGVGDVTAPSSPAAACGFASPRMIRRFVSAVDVLAGTVEPAAPPQLVLVGVTALGLSDYQATPVGDRMPGVEIHAQAPGGLFDGTLLSRPAWTAGRTNLLWRAGSGRLAGAGTPGAALGGGGARRDRGGPRRGLFSSWAQRPRGRDLARRAPRRPLHRLARGDPGRGRESALTLRRQIERQRGPRPASQAGTAARRIQMGSLPSRPRVPRETRFTYACPSPRRKLGGDLYDFFRLDDDRLVFLIGTSRARSGRASSWW